MISPGPWKIYNYPNPFNAQTTIEYKITYDDKASLYVYDLTGRLISTIFTSKEHRAGTYTTIFSASMLAKGSYILVLRGTEAVATQQIVVN